MMINNKLSNTTANSNKCIKCCNKKLTTSSIIWKILTFPLFLIKYGFMIANLIILYFLYTNKDEILQFINEIRTLVTKVTSLIDDVSKQLQQISELKPLITNALTQLAGIESKIDLLLNK